eukprot:CAMPEP_0171466032 /NCGR_PEP_ID=MMETSP0945-20130129/8939_1 /TAXON_ID=109269 /ORGANISM="Vaucheria litorea, Strain CCMP2940" /LENGTH=145 /DNA_ID=CAMNT_0011993891 /DNA_START=81 /DNA_END=516 /DNA_ORIENTATION=-
MLGRLALRSVSSRTAAVAATRGVSTAARIAGRKQSVAVLGQRFQAVRQPLAPLGVRMFSDTFLPVEEVQERVINVVKAFEQVEDSKVTPTSHFINDLGLDSLDTVEVVMAIEEEFVIEIPDDMAEKLLTIEDAVKFVSQHPQAKE